MIRTIHPSMGPTGWQVVADELATAADQVHELRLLPGVYDADGSGPTGHASLTIDAPVVVRPLGPVLWRSTHPDPGPSRRLWRVRAKHAPIDVFRVLPGITFEYAAAPGGNQQRHCILITGSDVNVDDDLWVRGIDIDVDVTHCDDGDGVYLSHRTEDATIRGRYRDIGRNPISWGGKSDPSTNLRSGLYVDIDAAGCTKGVDLEASQGNEEYDEVEIRGKMGRCHLNRTSRLLLRDCTIPRGVLLGGQRGQVVIDGYTRIGADPIQITQNADGTWAKGPGSSGHPIGSNGSALALRMRIGADVVLYTSPGSVIHPDTGVEYHAGIFSLTSPPSKPGDNLIESRASMLLHAGQHVWDPHPSGRVRPGGVGCQVRTHRLPEYLP